MFFLDVRTLIYFLNLYFLLYFHNRVKIKNCCCCCKFCVFKPFFWRTFLKITFSDGRLLLKDTFYYYYCSVAVRISNRGGSTNVTSTLAETEGKKCFFSLPTMFCFHRASVASMWKPKRQGQKRKVLANHSAILKVSTTK